MINLNLNLVTVFLLLKCFLIICQVLFDKPISPQSSSSFQGRETILLQGPNGCGKVTVVQAACRRLHLHLLKVTLGSGYRHGKVLRRQCL